jgi:DNA (cytosine-5)-methyltransferase 1
VRNTLPNRGDQCTPVETRYTLGSFCTGFGGLDRGVETVLGPAYHLWHTEYDPACDPTHALYKKGNPTNPYWKTPVLEAHWPGVPNLGDIEKVDWATVPVPDIVTGGFPCKDVSAAGRRAGLGRGTRSGIWGNIAHAIGTLRPSLVLLENVRALLSTPAHRSTDDGDTPTDSHLEPWAAGLGDRADRPVLRAVGAVLGDLADLGFDAQWVTVPASTVGAPHRRERVFILAWPADSEGVGHWHARAQGRLWVSAAAVAGGAGTGGLTALLPTPMARLGGNRGTPSIDVAADRLDSGRRNLDDAVALLPTPVARDGDGRGEGSADYWDRKRDKGRSEGLPLGAVVALLPTPRATDGVKGGPNQRGSSGDLMLPSAVMELLPTPTVTPHGDNQPPSAGMAARPSLNSLATTDRWGRYAAAIHRWERILGRPAPEPTETGTKGQPRLSPRFVEWLMGSSDGWVTDHLPRNQALGALGDGVVPQQAAHAMRLALNAAVAA